MQRAAKASSKEKRNTSNGSSSNSFGPLSPPPINYAKSRTPSPTHRMLAKSPQLDGPSEGGNRTFGSPSLSAPKLGASAATADSATKGSSQRLSPVSARSQLPSEDSDGDADVETEKPKSGRERIGGDGGLEKKRSLKRDKSERIRGRRASQSKEKDVDKVKMTASSSPPAADPTATATVSLPTSSFEKKQEDLVRDIQKVSLEEKHSAVAATTTPSSMAKAIPSKLDAQQTPIAQRVQSIPTVKNDLFSSPAEPKVGLPGTSPNASAAEELPASTEEPTPAPAPEPAKPEEVVPKTPEPPPVKTMSFDWAADDDELDDELPDLDDWGVTLTPIKPAAPAAPASAPSQSKDKAEEKVSGGRNAKSKADDSGGVWRRGGMLDAPNKGGKTGRQDRGNAKGASIKGSASAAAGSDLGIRIAGRAKEASLSPEPESTNGSKANASKPPPPASTPYGRWNKPSSTPTPPAEDTGVTFKGSGNRKAPPPSATSTSTARPKVADLGSLANLLHANDTKKPADVKSARSRQASPVVDRGEEFAAPATKKVPSVKDSIHAPPSVADSMHAPKPGLERPQRMGMGRVFRQGPGRVVAVEVGGRRNPMAGENELSLMSSRSFLHSSETLSLPFHSVTINVSYTRPYTTKISSF